jgi:hypothetical protein
MTTEELIYALDQRYGNSLAKDCELIQEATKRLQELNDMINKPVIDK